MEKGKLIALVLIVAIAVLAVSGVVARGCTQTPAEPRFEKIKYCL